MQQFLVITIIGLLVSSIQNDMEGFHNSLENSMIPVTSHETMKNSNTTVYLGYVNNPFGPSIRFQHRENLDSTSYRIPISKLRQTRYDKKYRYSKSDFIDTGQLLQNSEKRSKRSVIHLYNMVSCATGCNPLIYKGYGCYCGFLGSGIAVDGIDRCCKKHDRCYDTSKCPTLLEYIIPYYWECHNNSPLCAIDHAEWGGPGSCAQRLCECDKKLSECLSRYPCPSSRALCRTSALRLLQNALMIF